MKETLLRRLILAVALLGLVTGLAVGEFGGVSLRSVDIWAAATLPVVAVLAVSILRDFWIGRFGVDAIALVSMTAALVLGQPLAAVVVAIMYAGGTVLEDYARGRAERDLRLLTDRSPRTANRVLDGGVETVPVEDVAVGERLLVRAGEILPVDGSLLDEHALVDEAAVTGEPLPVRLRAGGRLRSGTVNAGEAFRMLASARAEHSTYSGIVRMVEAAQTAKAPFMRIADRFALFLLPATLIVAAVAWNVSGDPIRALAVLVVATPCPLILAAPVAFIGGVSRAARAGILMKGSSALEAMASVRTAIFDKTGTLTFGGAELLEVVTAPGIDPNAALRLLASLEQASHHVLAEATIRAARERGLLLSHPEGVREHRGSGIEGRVDGAWVRAGSRLLVAGTDPLPEWTEQSVIRRGGDPALSVFVAVDAALVALLVFGDALRADARSALAGLRDRGIDRIVMLTGDDAETAQRVGKTLSVDTVLADASPADKVEAVSREMAKAPSLMVGDGINDAPALAAATVGVAMAGRGATASSEAADVIVLTDRLKPVAEAVGIARHTRAIAMQSIVAGLALSGAAMIAAALGFLTPVAGALLQEGIDVAVILNALRSLGGGRPGDA